MYTPKKSRWMNNKKFFLHFAEIYMNLSTVHPPSLLQSTLHQGVMLNWLQYPKVYSYIIEKYNWWLFISLLRIGTWDPSQSELELLSVWSLYHVLYLTEVRGMGNHTFHKIIKVNYYSIWKRNSLGEEKEIKIKKIHALVLFTKNNNFWWVLAPGCAVTSSLALNSETALPLGRLRARCSRGRERKRQRSRSWIY